MGYREQIEALNKAAYEVAASQAVFIRDVQKKAFELGGKIVFVHDEIIIDLPVTKLGELRAWAKKHPAPALVKRGFL